MDFLQQYSQLMLMQSLASQSGMPMKETPLKLEDFSSKMMASPSTSSSNDSPVDVSQLLNFDPVHLVKMLQNLEKLFAAPKAIKTELLHPASPVSSKAASPLLKPKTEFSPFPQPREYKVHVNRESAKPLREWMNKNIHNPYPTPEEVKLLGEQTGFTHRQIRNWFTNSRRRYEQRCGEEPLPWVKKEAPKYGSRRQSSPPSSSVSSPDCQEA